MISLFSSVPISFLVAIFDVVVIIAFTFYLRPRQQDRDRIEQLESLLDHEREKRNDDRTGRTRAERLLREQRQVKNSGELSLKPIGYIRSVFRDRRGTPRQSLLAKHSRSELVLQPFVQAQLSLSGLEEFSHVWIIGIFHENTDSFKSQDGKFRTKIAPPRLNGVKKGIFATRSPHRPNPISLSIGRIESITENRILLTGLDLIDGTPVLDLKPYVERYDAIRETSCPDWIRSVFAQGEVPLTVNFSDQNRSQLSDLIHDLELYDDIDSVQLLIEEVLQNDIRSLHQRFSRKSDTTYTVRLDRLLIRYSLEGDRQIVIQDMVLHDQTPVPASLFYMDVLT